MDEELKAMLEGAKAQGANDTDLGKIIDMYEADASKKKGGSKPTSTPQKSVSETPIGSSGGVNSKMKTFNGLSNAELKKVNSQDKPLLAINQNIKNKIKEKSLRNELKSTKVTPENMESISLKTDNLSKITKENQESDALYERNKKDDYSFLDYSKDTAISGVGTFYKSIADTPELLYDIATQTFINPRLEAEGSPFLLKTGDEVADDLGLKNIPADILQVQIKEANERIKSYSDKNGIDPLKAIQDGNYSGAAKLIAGTTIQSAPLMIAAILSGGSSLGLTAVGVSSAATQNSDLKAEHPEMNVNTRIKNAVATGVIEATVGSLFTGASGAVAKRIIADKGVEVGSKIIAKSFRGSLEKVITKNPIVGALGEVAEEMIVEGSHQTKDIITGIRADYDLHAIGNAGVSSTGMGAVNTLAVYGAKGYVKSKDYAKLKSTNKEVFKLRSEIENGNLSDENKAILGLRADRLEAENKKLLGTEIEKVKALPSDVKTELNALNDEFESLKSKFDDIDDADDIPDNLKPAMKEEIKIQAAKNQKRKTEILSQNDGLEVDNDFSNFDGVEPDFNLENGKISSLPLKEQDRLNDQALQELTGGDMSIEVTKEQVSQKANEIYTNEQTPPTSETKPQAEVPQQAEAEKVAEFPLLEGETFIDKKTDSKGNIHTTVALTTEKDGRKKTKFLFNRSDKDAGQRNMTSISPEKLSSDFGFEISKDDVPEGFEVTRVKEIRETDKGSGATVTIKNIENDESWDADIIITKTKETPKPQEVSPVEDVVAPSVEKPLSSQELSKDKVDSNSKKFNIEGKDIFHHASDSKRNGRLKISNAPQFGTGVYFSTNKELVENEYGSDNTTSVKLNIENPVYSGSKEWNEVNSLAIEKADKDYGEKKGLKLNEDETYFRYNKDNLSEIDEIPSKFISDAAKELGYDAIIDKGSNEYENEVVVLDESKIIYPEDEATPETNTPTNGNVQLGASNVGESGNAKPKSNSKSSVPSSVDGGEVKGDAKQVIVDGDDLILNHGTPHNFDKFQLEKIGTGEGAQAFGYGLYFTDGSKIAEGYARKLSEDKTGVVYSVRIKNGRTANWAEWREPLDETQEQDLYNSLTPEERKQYEEHTDKAFDYQSPNYDIKYLKDYHGSLDDLKPNSDGVVEYGENDKPVSAGSLYSDLKDAFGQEKATEIFKRAGIDGIKYRAKKGIGDNYNYVVFNPESITIESKSGKPTETPQPKSKGYAGKIIEPHSEVNTDVETVKKELKLNEVESLVYDSFKDIPKYEIIDKVDDVVEKWKDDKYGEIEAIESKINDIDIKIEDNGDAIDKINDDETISPAKTKKAIAVLEKEFKDLQKQQKELEEQKEAVNESLKQIDDVLFHPTEDYNIDLINEVVDKVNNRLETRKSIKEGTNLFPDDANIPEFVAVKKELIKLTDEKTIAEFNNRTAEQIEESKPIIKDIESKAENAERISKKELEKGIDDAEKLLKKPTTKERIAERIKLSDAKIDENSDVVKAKIKAFMDMFPSADINPDDYHTNGFSADAIIDMVAKAAKAIAKGGIVTSEHIKEAIKAYNTHFDDEIDPKAVEEKINPKVEEEKDFKREKGKSSVLKRIREGGNSTEINKIIDKIGLNYEGRKQEQVYADGVNFVKEVGIAEAYNAIKNGELKDSDTINVVYATILQGFSNMAENEISKVSDPQELSDLVKELDDLHEKIYTEFKAKTIDAGRGSAILNFIYNQDLKIRYSLAQQIENFKKVNNGVVPDETLAKMKELDKQYQEANKKIEELEVLLKEAQEQKYFENIVEEEKRQPKQSKSKREKAEKIIKALDDFEKSILKNSYSDVTMVTPILIQGIRAAKLAVKANVEISEAIEKAIEGIKIELAKLGKNFEDEERFRAGLNKSLETNGVDTKQPKVTVDKTGKVRIPTEMIKDFISKGGTDLSEFATQLQESIKDEFPDVTVRDIRESVANYGKKANKSKPQISEDIQKLKSEERLRLEYEDLQNRISKEKNETKKRTLSQTAKRLKEQIKQLQDDLGVTEQERTNRSVNYTKKRIEILRDKIKNNDFAKKEVKPIIESPELREAKIEKNRVQEEFDYLSYQQEIKNRTFLDKAKGLAKDIYDSQRVTLATGEMSFVGAQGGLYMVDATFSRETLKNLIKNFKGTTAKEWKANPFGTVLKMVKSAHSAESLIKMFNAMGTANNYIDFQRMLKEDVNYDVYLKSGLRILSEDVKSKVHDELFIGNNILTLLKVPVHLIDRIEKKELMNLKLSLSETEKKRTTLQGYYEKLKTGKISDKNKKTATEIFSNANPLATFERGNSVFMNMARVEMFNKYAAVLYASGKNPIDHLSDFKKLASAVNTITGSGNMNQTVTMALPGLNKLMFSARYFAASWNLTPPMSLYYLAKLGNYDGMELNKPNTWKTWKPTVAQKAFVKPMVKGFVAFYGLSLMTMAIINASIDDDDEMTEEEKARKKAYIEYDPRSSDFLQVISGNTRTDFFGPYRGNVVLLSKLLSGKTKNKKGEIIDNGAEYGSRTDFQIGSEYLAGKANPFPGMFIRYGQGKKEKVINPETGIEEEKRMLFGKEIGIGYQVKHNMLPIFATTVKDIVNEDPVLGATFYTTLALFGKQTSIYKDKVANTPEQKFIKDQAKKKALFELSDTEKDKIRVDDKLTRVESKIKMLQEIKIAQQQKLPYYISKDVALTKEEVSEIDLTGSDESIAETMKIIKQKKKEYKIDEEE